MIIWGQILSNNLGGALMYVEHILKPIYNRESKILILGTIPSPKSREIGFYYSHPQNRFWKVLADILEVPIPTTISEKKDLLLKNNIALWDVLASCDIVGASDSSIKNPKPNDILNLVKQTQIKQIFVTGKKAEALYNKLCLKNTKMPCICLPSTSPANCSLNYTQLKAQYQLILNHLK